MSVFPVVLVTVMGLLGVQILVVALGGKLVRRLDALQEVCVSVIAVCRPWILLARRSRALKTGSKASRSQDVGESG